MALPQISLQKSQLGDSGEPDVTHDALEHILGRMRSSLHAGRTIRGRALRSLQQAFRVFDKDSSGVVQGEEFREALHRLDLGLSDAQLSHLLAFFDADGTGNVDHNEFVTALVHRGQHGLRAVEPETEKGQICVVKAAGLKSADSMDGEGLGSDPFCDVYWNGTKVGSTAVVWDSCEPVWLTLFDIGVDTRRTNVLRIEVYDFDDSPVDDEPDFLGQVVLTGRGREALPDAAVSYPLTKKGPGDEMMGSFVPQKDAWKKRFTSLSAAAAEEEELAKQQHLARLNEMVGGSLTLRFQHAVATVDDPHATQADEDTPSLQDFLATPHTSVLLDLGWGRIGCPQFRAKRRGSLEKVQIPVEELVQSLVAERGYGGWHMRDELGKRAAEVAPPPSAELLGQQVGRKPSLSMVRRLNLARNELQGLAGVFRPILPVLPFHSPLALQSLDLSFNHLSSFSDVLICSQLVTLQLHGNPIRDWREVAILSQLTKLSKLTLHGSPIEQQPGYRRIALATVKPLRLRQLDFSTVTAAELAEALQSSQPGPPFVIPLRHSPSPSLMARSSGRRASPALSRAERLARYTELSRPVGRYSGEYDQEALQQQSPGAIGRQRRSRSRFSLSPERARHLAKLSRPKKLF